jgi:hypothetical protein
MILNAAQGGDRSLVARPKILRAQKLRQFQNTSFEFMQGVNSHGVRQRRKSQIYKLMNRVILSADLVHG